MNHPFYINVVFTCGWFQKFFAEYKIYKFNLNKKTLFFLINFKLFNKYTGKRELICKNINLRQSNVAWTSRYTVTYGNQDKQLNKDSTVSYQFFLHICNGKTTLASSLTARRIYFPATFPNKRVIILSTIAILTLHYGIICICEFNISSFDDVSKFYKSPRLFEESPARSIDKTVKINFNYLQILFICEKETILSNVHISLNFTTDYYKRWIYD